MVAGSKPSFFILFSGSVKKWPAGDDGLGVHAHSANVVYVGSANAPHR